MNPHSAGIDVGDQEHYVAVPSGSVAADKVVRRFGSFTCDLEAIADWLTQCGVTTVAMESTGVYWIPLFEILEARGFQVALVDTRRLRSVPGRKSDVMDCQWLQQLHMFGLLSGAFRPEQQIVELRTLMRQRQLCTTYAAEHIQHMQKSLQQMNVKLSTVINDVTGVTGMSIIKAILGGERNAKKLAQLRDERCHSDEATIAKALRGNWRADHLFTLRQAVDLYEVYREKIRACDQEIEGLLSALPDLSEGAPAPVKKKRPTKNAPQFDARTHLFRAFGVDLLEIGGIDANTGLTLLSEIGTDMTRWKTASHFAAWLGLCPQNSVSGGKVFKRGTGHNSNRAAQALRMCAQTISRTKSALGAFYRRMQNKGGGKYAVTATAHKLARTIYSMLTNGQAYVDIGESEYERQYQERLLKGLKLAASRLGYNLVRENDLPNMGLQA